MKHRKAVALLAVGVMTVTLSGCLWVPSGTQASVVGLPSGAASYDEGDPAAVPFQQSGTWEDQMYTTQDTVNNYNVPSWTWNPATGASVGFHDALPNADAPSWTEKGHAGGGGGIMWAPSVTYVDGEWVMAFAASVYGLGDPPPPCIGFAVSSASNGPDGTFKGLPAEFCPSGVNQWSIDPYLFVDGSSVYLLWTQEIPNTGGPGNSAVWSEPLDISGTGAGTSIQYVYPAQPQEIMTYAQAAAIAGSSFNGGGYVENPAAVIGPSGGVDVTASVGSWNGGQYWTEEVGCGSLSSSSTCNYASDSWNLSTVGGASFLTNDSPGNTNQIFFGVQFGSNRIITTESVNQTGNW